MKKLSQNSAPHPGEILLELYLKISGLSVCNASFKIGVEEKELELVVNGQAPISPLLAIKLSEFFNTSPQYWMNLQANYELGNCLK